MGLSITFSPVYDEATGVSFVRLSEGMGGTRQVVFAYSFLENDN